MNRFMVRFLYLVLIMLPVGNHAVAADDDLLELEDEIMVEEGAMVEEGSMAEEDVMADEELVAAVDDDLLEGEDDLLGGEDDLLGDDSASAESDEISLGFGGNKKNDGEEVFPVAYEHIDDMKIYDPARYKERRGEFGYYKTGAPVSNSFRVNENNEESTDETIGILFFIVALPAQLYVNFYGWWQ